MEVRVLLDHWAPDRFRQFCIQACARVKRSWCWESCGFSPAGARFEAPALLEVGGVGFETEEEPACGGHRVALGNPATPLVAKHAFNWLSRFLFAFWCCASDLNAWIAHAQRLLRVAAMLGRGLARMLHTQPRYGILECGWECPPLPPPHVCATTSPLQRSPSFGNAKQFYSMNWHIRMCSLQTKDTPTWSIQLRT